MPPASVGQSWPLQTEGLVASLPGTLQPWIGNLHYTSWTTVWVTACRVCKKPSAAHGCLLCGSLNFVHLDSLLVFVNVDIHVKIWISEFSKRSQICLYWVIGQWLSIAKRVGLLYSGKAVRLSWHPRDSPAAPPTWGQGVTTKSVSVYNRHPPILWNSCTEFWSQIIIGCEGLSRILSLYLLDAPGNLHPS